MDCRCPSFTQACQKFTSMHICHGHYITLSKINCNKVVIQVSCWDDLHLNRF